MQQEVRALLHDYLTDDQSGTVSARNPIASVNEVLRFPRPRDGSKVRPKARSLATRCRAAAERRRFSTHSADPLSALVRSQQVFKFADSDLQASHALLKAHEDSLNAAIKAAVPGLITDGAPSTTTTSALIVASTDPSAGAGRSSGLKGTHKALVPADAFNVSVLFGPTLAFLDRVREIMPGGLMGEDETNASTGFGGFLDEFVLRTFLPQLEEKVASVFHQAVGGASLLAPRGVCASRSADAPRALAGIDAFQEDPNYKRVSRVPIVRVRVCLSGCVRLSADDSASSSSPSRTSCSSSRHCARCSARRRSIAKATASSSSASFTSSTSAALSASKVRTR